MRQTRLGMVVLGLVFGVVAVLTIGKGRTTFAA